MKKTALIMIDMQRGFIDPSSPICIAGAAGTVPACAEAIRFFHEAELPVFYAVRHYRADGSDVEKARARCGQTGESRCRRRAMRACPMHFPRNLRSLTATGS